ncbi:MAG: HD domain-containing protein [Bacillus sp. (in: firmicutes)]
MNYIDKHIITHFEYNCFPHEVWKEPNGNYYCRAANAILQEGTHYCRYCPLFGGCRKGEQAGNPECCYYDLEPKENLNSMKDKQRTDGLIKAGVVSEFPDYANGYDMVEAAYQFAAHAHRRTYRKGTKIPYITHLMETAAIVKALTADPEVIAASILHDVVSKVKKYKLSDIENRFNKRIAHLVGIIMEDKRKALTLTWRQRKQDYLTRLEEAPDEAKIIALGDHLSNIRAVYRTCQENGRGNMEAEIGWYYRSVCDRLKVLSDSGPWKEFDFIIHDMFGRK